MPDRRLVAAWRAVLAVLVLTLFVGQAWATGHQVLHSFHPSGTDGTFPYGGGLLADAAGNRYGTTSEGGADNAGTVFELSPQQGGGWTQKVLYSFSNNGRDGVSPNGGLVLDAAGNLYGTTFEGGIHAAGTAFELSPQPGGVWTETVLHSFGSKATDGYGPYAALIFDSAGNLYGTTQGGGIHSGGTVFALSPRHGGGWTETVLHSLGGGTDGGDPLSSLVFDGGGNLYGTTQAGGIYGGGTVFELSPRLGGGWTEKVLHSFGYGTDGANPFAGLIVDAAGNLFGATYQGGIHSCSGFGCGTVFELSPRQGGGWIETVLHSFGNGTDGTFPEATLLVDASGNLYGTASSGGIHGWGAIFQLSARQGGGWTETVLHSFNKNGTDGAAPSAALSLDAAGGLYSTTSSGGSGSVGVVFELSPKQGGGWTEAVLYSFNFNGTDGGTPLAGMVKDSAGNFYGTTSEGGAYDSGTVFELTPAGGGGWTEQVLYSFGKDTDGATPQAGLIFDANANLYGTTAAGGIHGYGTVFELTPSGEGWTEKVLHSFNHNGEDGALPFAGVVFDAFGNLYGTTYEGGIHNWGTVFQLSPRQGGGVTETVLHSFNLNGVDGFLPRGGLIVDAIGNLYGTTQAGGIYFSGTVFKLSPRQGGGWAETVLHSLGSVGDGALPFAGLIFDAAGNLYGTSFGGGIHGYGAAFQLTPRQDGGWTEKVLHSFDDADGGFPEAGLIMNAAGNLYGTTYEGGVNNYGAVFELIPRQGGDWDETVLHNFNFALTDGTYPQSSLIFDTAGDLYGTTSVGGAYNSGTVFEIAP